MTSPLSPEETPVGPGDVQRLLAELRRHVGHLERAVETQLPGAQRAARAIAGEERWPVSAAVAVTIVLQAVLDRRLTLGPGPLLPGLEAILGVALFVANPRRITRRSQALRLVSLSLVALTSLANGWASFALIRLIVTGRHHLTAPTLLANGAAIYLTNIIVFGLWYWEWDAGGPAARAHEGRPFPDFLFPQDTASSLGRPGWFPTFVDYLYVSYTNATAFSPTDTMPLSRWSKLLMMVQSAVALVTVGLVVARAVNILP
ncbi:MAG: hypothetical protein ACYDEN_03580 [Acidimicrobiales bacterium]